MQRCLSRFLFRKHTPVQTRMSITPAKAIIGLELHSPVYAILPSTSALSEPRESLRYVIPSCACGNQVRKCWCANLTRGGLGCWDDFCKEQATVPRMCCATGRQFVATSIICAGLVSRRLSDTGATVGAYFGLTRLCGCCVIHPGFVLAHRPPFCVASSVAHGAKSTDRRSSDRPASANARSTSPYLDIKALSKSGGPLRMRVATNLWCSCGPLVI